VWMDGRSVRVIYFGARQKAPVSPAGRRPLYVPFVTTAQMYLGTRTRRLAFALAFLFALVCAQQRAVAQDDFDDDAADPVKLFNKGQDAHAKKNY
jgi:hypothetical protein